MSSTTKEENVAPRQRPEETGSSYGLRLPASATAASRQGSVTRPRPRRLSPSPSLISRKRRQSQDDAVNDADEEDKDPKDTSWIHRSFKRLKPLFPNMPESLPRSIMNCIDGDEQQTIAALHKLHAVLKKETATEQTTVAFLHACGHDYVVWTMENMGRHVTNKRVAAMIYSAALNVLYQLSSRRHAVNLQGLAGGLASIRTTLVSVGALDYAFDAHKLVPNDADMAKLVLSLVGKLVEVYSFQACFDVGIATHVCGIMKHFPTTQKIQLAATKILRQMAKLNHANGTWFDKCGAVTLLAATVEQFSQQDKMVRDKAASTLRKILALETLPDSDNDDDDDDDNSSSSSSCGNGDEEKVKSYKLSNNRLVGLKP